MQQRGKKNKGNQDLWGISTSIPDAHPSIHTTTQMWLVITRVPSSVISSLIQSLASVHAGYWCRRG